MLTNMLIEGLIYAVVLGAIVTISQLFNARLWLNCYPEAIQSAVPKRTKKEMRAKMLVGIPFMLIMFGYPVLSTFMLKSALGSEYTYWIGFMNLLVIQNMFNLFDLVVLDWIVFCSKPKYLVLEGTQDMVEYKDYVFHAKAAGKGLLMSVLFSAAVAAITLI